MVDPTYDPIMANFATALIFVLPAAAVLVLVAVQRAMRDRNKITNARDEIDG